MEHDHHPHRRETYLCQFTIPTVTAVTEPVINDLTVFPNPAQTSLTVDFSPMTTSTADLTIVDLTGRIRLRQPANPIGKQLLNVAGLPAGMYILRLSDGRARRFFKID